MTADKEAAYWKTKAKMYENCLKVIAEDSRPDAYRLAQKALRIGEGIDARYNKTPGEEALKSLSWGVQKPPKMWG